MKSFSGLIVRMGDPDSSLAFLRAEDEYHTRVEQEALRLMQRRLGEDLSDAEMDRIKDFADRCRERRTRFSTAIEARRAKAEGLVIK